MNTTFLIIGLCNIAIGASSIKRVKSKRNIVAYLNLMLGAILIVLSFTLFKNAE